MPTNISKKINFYSLRRIPRELLAGMNAERGEGGRGNGSFSVAESSESSSVENRGVFKINSARLIPSPSLSREQLCCRDMDEWNLFDRLFLLF